MLDTAGLTKEWWGEVILTVCHVLNKVSMKDRNHTIRGMGKEKIKPFLFTYLGLLGQSERANQ
jgi:hypothetical protein